MKTATLTPWTYPDEFLYTYKNLFSSDVGCRTKATRQISLWAERGSLPLSIESTYQLMITVNVDPNFDFHLTNTSQPCIGDELDIRFEFIHSISSDPLENCEPLIEKNMCSQNFSDDHFRLMYSMALVRFVNGLVDSKQNRMYAQSISKLAEDIGLPRWFVDLRHEITHSKLPSLESLRLAVKEALLWLHDSYWIFQVETIVNLDEDILAALEKYLTVYMECLPFNSRSFLNVESPPKALEKAVGDFFYEFESAGICIHLQKKMIHQMIDLISQHMAKNVASPEYWSYVWLPILTQMMENSTLFFNMILHLVFDYMKIKCPDYSYASASQSSIQSMREYFSNLDKRNPVIFTLLSAMELLLTRYLNFIRNRYYLTIPLKDIIRKFFLMSTPWSLKMVEKIKLSGLIDSNSSIHGLIKILNCQLSDSINRKEDLEFYNTLSPDEIIEKMKMRRDQAEQILTTRQTEAIVKDDEMENVSTPCPLGLLPDETAEELLKKVLVVY